MDLLILKTEETLRYFRLLLLSSICM